MRNISAYRLVIIFYFLLPSGILLAQQPSAYLDKGRRLFGRRNSVTTAKQETDYKHSIMLGGRLNSNGWSGQVYHLRKTGNTIKGYELGFSEIRHEKEFKQKGKSSKEFGRGLPYIYGKVNSVYSLNFGVVREYVILPSAINDKSSIGWRWGCGLSLALLKPYYLKLQYIENIGGRDSMFIRERKYSREDSAAFLNPSRIFGASKWSKSLPEITFIPGIYLETAVSLLPDKTSGLVQGVAVGAFAALYQNKLPILANNATYRWNGCLFLEISLGTRWN